MDMDKKEKHNVLMEILDKVKMHKAAEKMDRTDMPEVSSSKSNIYYPSVYLKAEQLPDLKEYEVDDKVNLIVRGRVKSHSMRENDDDSKEDFEIEIREIGCLKNSHKEEE